MDIKRGESPGTAAGGSSGGDIKRGEGDIRRAVVVRFGVELLEGVRRWAGERGMTQHGAIVGLVERGLREARRKR